MKCFYLFWGILLFSKSCLKDDLSGCYRSHSIKIVAEVLSGGDVVDIQDIKHVDLYIFNKEGKFLDKITCKLNEYVDLNYPEEEILNIVGFANISESNETITLFAEGILEKDGKICLIKFQDYLSQPIYGSPSDILWGETGVSGSDSGNTAILPVKRIVASVNVKVRGLEELTKTNSDFRIVLSTKYHTVDFNGNAMGNDTNYLPEGGVFASRNPSQFEIPTFRIFATSQGTPVDVKVYYKDKLLDIISKDNEGNQLLAYNGKLLEIKISYLENAALTIQMTSDWDTETIWKDI